MGNWAYSILVKKMVSLKLWLAHDLGRNSKNIQAMARRVMFVLAEGQRTITRLAMEQTYERTQRGIS